MLNQLLALSPFYAAATHQKLAAAAMAQVCTAAAAAAFVARHSPNYLNIGTQFGGRFYIFYILNIITTNSGMWIFG